ncbi:hypothetical protein BHE74_00039182 [Ensete ventricosum]|nr:hypothetical protein BHE74_00039182 [Ensete ventricosum]
MMQRANHYIAAKTLIAEKHEEHKRPRMEQSRGPTSGPSRRRVEGLDFSYSRLALESVRPAAIHGNLNGVT